MNWTVYWARLDEDNKDQLRKVGLRYLGMIHGIDDDGSILTDEAIAEITEYQNLENDILTAHAEWQSRTKTMFERLGIDWTTDNLNRWYRLWAVE